MLLGLLRFVKEGICAHGTECVRASVCSKSSQLQCRLRLEGICGIRRRAIEQARLLRLLLRIRSKSTKTERILLRLLGIARVRSRSQPAASKDVCCLLWLGIARVRSRSKPAASKDVCWLLLRLLRLLRLSKERWLVLCGIRRCVTEQARLLRLLLRVRSESTKTERILLRLLGVARVRSRSKPAASKDVCWLLLLLLRLLGIARVRSRSKPAPKDVCWLLLLLLLRLLRLSEERLLVWLLSLLGVLPKSTKDTLLLL